MTQKELRSKLDAMVLEGNDEDRIILLINQHVAEVIGEDDRTQFSPTDYYKKTNDLRAEQRKRANL